MLLVRVSYKPGGYIAEYGDLVWTLGRNEEQAHTALCEQGAHIIYRDGDVGGLYAIPARNVPGYHDNLD